MSLNITPPSSPRSECFGSPIRRGLNFFDSPPKIRRIEINQPQERKPHWMNDAVNRISPESPIIPLTPMGKVKNGDFCKVEFFESPIGDLVERSFFVGVNQKNSSALTPDGLHFVKPTNFHRQIDSIEMNLDHCLSPITMKREIIGNTLKVSQIFPAGIPLDDYVKMNPEKIDIVSELWSSAIFETNQISQKFVSDPKPSNAIVINQNNSISVKLIDIEIIDADDIDEMEEIIGCRYFIGDDIIEKYNLDAYETAIQLGIIDMKTSFKMDKKELHSFFISKLN